MFRNVLVTGFFTTIILFGLTLCCKTQLAFGQEEENSSEQQATIDQLTALAESLDPQVGDISLGNELLTLSVPDDFYFLDAQDAETVLVEIWGNPPGQDVLGMLLPTGYTPLDFDSWAVTIQYTDDGHVSDNDAAGIDYDDMLQEMQTAARDGNEDRIDEGYEPIEIVGWAEPPHYAAASRKL